MRGEFTRGGGRGLGFGASRPWFAVGYGSSSPDALSGSRASLKARKEALEAELERTKELLAGNQTGESLSDETK